MTFKEAKKILEKEGFYLIKFGGPSDIVNDPFSEYESPEIFEAGKVVNSAGSGVGMHGEVFNERKARLKKEYEENTKAPGEEQTKEKKGIIYPTTFPKADFYHKYFLNEGYSALKESAFQFNDALLDEQGKKIKRLGKEIAKLNSIIHDKNAVLSDVAEELRLTKIREKNLTEVGQKYVKEVEDLREQLANKVVDKIDAQALKSAESALAWNEKVVTYKDMALAYYEKKIAEKDEVIADLGNELAATKKELEEKTKLVEAVRKSSKEDRDYGIAAEKMIQKMAKEIVNDSPVPSKDYKQYRLWANGYRFNPQLPDFSKEEEKKLEHAKKIRVSSDNAEEGADLYGVIVLCGKDYIDALKKAEDADIWQE